MESKKPHGNRKYSKELILEEAKKYHTKAEFLLQNEGAFRSGRAFGKEFFEKMCSHMVSFRFSTPQLICKKILESTLETSCSYNNRSVLGGGFELDIFFESFNLAIEYNGVAWHEKDIVIERDKLKAERCKELGIFLVIVNQDSIYPIHYEQDIKKVLIENLATINKASGKTLVADDILKVDCSDIFEEVAKAANRTPERIKEKVASCSSIKEFAEKYYSDYKFLLRNRQTHLLDDIRTYSKDISNEEAFAASLKFSSLMDFRMEDPNMYQICSKRGLMSIVMDHLSTPRRAYKLQTDDQIVRAYKERIQQNKKISPRMLEEVEKRDLFSKIDNEC